MWSQQAELIITSHKLHHFLADPSIPHLVFSIDDSVAYQVNIAFEACEVQDQILLSWLQSTISKEMLTIVIRSKHSWQLWDQIHAFLQTHTDAKSQRFQSELRATQLDQGSV